MPLRIRKRRTTVRRVQTAKKRMPEGRKLEAKVISPRCLRPKSQPSQLSQRFRSQQGRRSRPDRLNRENQPNRQNRRRQLPKNRLRRAVRRNRKFQGLPNPVSQESRRSPGFPRRVNRRRHRYHPHEQRVLAAQCSFAPTLGATETGFARIGVPVDLDNHRAWRWGQDWNRIIVVPDLPPMDDEPTAVRLRGNTCDPATEFAGRMTRLPSGGEGRKWQKNGKGRRPNPATRSSSIIRTPSIPGVSA